MFRFSGKLTPAAFAVRALPLTAVFVSTIFGFPYVAYVVMKMSHCAGIGGACGAIGLVTALEFKPICFYGFVALLCGFSVPRARDLGLPALCGLFPPVMVLADRVFGLYAGAGWAAAFTAGVLRIYFPYFLSFAASLIVFACVAPTNCLRPENTPKLRQLLFGLGVALTVTAALNRSPILAFTTASLCAPWLMAAMVVVLATLAWRGRGSASIEEPKPTDRSADSTRGRIIRRAVVAATILTIIAYFLAYNLTSVDRNPLLWLLTLPMAFDSILIPTFILYLATAAAFLNWRAHRTRSAVGWLAASLLPFLLWGFAEFRTFRAHWAEAAEIAQIPTIRVSHLPHALVSSDQNIFCSRIRAFLPEISEIIRDSYGSGLQREDCATAKQDGVKLEALDALPDEYVRLITGRNSRFSKAHHNYDSLGQPLELRYVAPGRDDLLAVSYQSFDPYPAFPPVMTAAGWFLADNSAMASAVRDREHAFVIESLQGRR